MPDAAAYLADQVATAQDLFVQQNAAADDYLFWSRKADAYVTILTVLAGSLVLATSVAWSVMVLVS